MNLKADYFFIYAKIDGVCKETGKEIKQGDKILYIPPVKGVCPGRIFCEDSNEYRQASKKISQSSYRF